MLTYLLITITWLSYKLFHMIIEQLFYWVKEDWYNSHHSDFMIRRKAEYKKENNF